MTTQRVHTELAFYNRFSSSAGGRLRRKAGHLNKSRRNSSRIDNLLPSQSSTRLRTRLRIPVSGSGVTGTNADAWSARRKNNG
mgnify:CR=1 FL=1